MFVSSILKHEMWIAAVQSWLILISDCACQSSFSAAHQIEQPPNPIPLKLPLHWSIFSLVFSFSSVCVHHNSKQAVSSLLGNVAFHRSASILMHCIALHCLSLCNPFVLAHCIACTAFDWVVKHSASNVHCALWTSSSSWLLSSYTSWSDHGPTIHSPIMLTIATSFVIMTRLVIIIKIMIRTMIKMVLVAGGCRIENLNETNQWSATN